MPLEMSRKTQRWLPALLLALAVTSLLAGCFLKSVEEAIQKALVERIGPADAYVVRLLETTDADVKNGRLNKIVVEGTRVRPKGAPVIDRLVARVDNARFDVDKRTLKLAQRAELSVEIREQDLVAYLREVRPELKTVRVFVVDDGRVVFLVESLKMRFTGRLVVNGLQVEFQLAEATEGGVAMDPDAASIVIDEVNPLLDLSTWPVTVSTAKLSLTPGRIALVATFDQVDASAFGGAASPVGKGAASTVENAVDGQVMIVVASGKSTLGRDGGPSEEAPPHEVGLQSFLLGRTEVTNAQFTRFVEATKYVTTAEKEGSSAVWQGGWKNVEGASWRHPGGKDTACDAEQPVVHVSKADADAYCAWANLRLPTEAEWERAARGSEALAWPWGTTFEASRCRSSVGGGADGPARVGAFPNGASPYGVLDLAGNVWEWTATSCERYPGNRDALYYDATAFILRGGSWTSSSAEKLRTTARWFAKPLLHSQQIGFRCAKSR